MFDADLDRWCARRPAGVYFTAHGSFLPLYPEGGWSWFAPTPEDPARADWPALVSRALSPGAGVRVEVLRVQHWVMNAFVAQRFRHGRILLAGDAAHAIPIIGGLGMNAGVADVHNLCWKLAGVLHGWAGPSLLESYETERQPVAHQTLQQAVANTRLLLQVQNRRRDQLQRGEATADGIELPWTEEYFAQLGLVLGVAYHSDAVLTDAVLTDAVHTDNGTPPEPPLSGTDYIPTTAPGHRMPHLWLRTDTSTLDTLGERFTLLTSDPARWERQALAATPWPLGIETLPREHINLCGLHSHGALLIRPDGHIGARWGDHPPTDASLRDALTTITRATPP